jgi:hypothetical protein
MLSVSRAVRLAGLDGRRWRLCLNPRPSAPWRCFPTRGSGFRSPTARRASRARRGRHQGTSLQKSRPNLLGRELALADWYSCQVPWIWKEVPCAVDAPRLLGLIGSAFHQSTFLSGPSNKSTPISHRNPKARIDGANSPGNRSYWPGRCLSQPALAGQGLSRFRCLSPGSVAEPLATGLL